MTPREALLEIRRQVHGYETMDEIDQIAQAGLDRFSALNTELSDLLADRLAEAHKLLRELNLMLPAKGQIVAASAENEDTLARIPSVLSLPPDLEAMVERRIGPR